MTNFISYLAGILETLANFAAGSVSIIIGYEPEIPEELK